MLLRTGSSIAISLAMMATAAAADLPSKVLPPTFVAAPPAVSWAGFYAGVHVGVAFTDLKTTNFDETPTGFVDTFNTSRGNVFGGGTIGYNLQTGHFVYGIEIDGGYMDLVARGVEPNTVNFLARIRPGVYADATGRIGYAADNFLFYVKGGFAYFGGHTSIEDVGEPLKRTNDYKGFTVGGGIEYLITPSLGAKIEYLYFDFGSKALRLDDGDRYTDRLSSHTVKVGLNYHFNSLPLAPVVARY